MEEDRCECGAKWNMVGGLAVYCIKCGRLKGGGERKMKEFGWGEIWVAVLIGALLPGVILTLILLPTILSWEIMNMERYTKGYTITIERQRVENVAALNKIEKMSEAIEFLTVENEAFWHLPDLTNKGYVAETRYKRI